jgi:hypothetical protein
LVVEPNLNCCRMTPSWSPSGILDVLALLIDQLHGLIEV